jgi:predicted nucleic acid-binding protein
MILVDANVLIDVVTADPDWADWSEAQMMEAAGRDFLAVNPIIYAEVAAAYQTAKAFERAMEPWPLTRLVLPYEAAWPASQAFLRYRHGGGQRQTPMPDFYIGAHALVEGLTLLTRDASRYRTYFPKVKLISP